MTVGSVAAAAVAGGPGLGARRARPDPQGAAGVAPADRAAAGADRVHVDHRQLDRAAADLARVGPPHLAVLDHADVAGGAAHVEAERVAVAARPGRAARRRPRRRPGPERTLQAPARAASSAGGDAAGGPHHQRRRQPGLARPPRRAAPGSGRAAGER